MREYWLVSRLLIQNASSCPTCLFKGVVRPTCGIALGVCSFKRRARLYRSRTGCGVINSTCSVCNKACSVTTCGGGKLLPGTDGAVGVDDCCPPPNEQEVRKRQIIIRRHAIWRNTCTGGQGTRKGPGYPQGDTPTIHGILVYGRDIPLRAPWSLWVSQLPNLLITPTPPVRGSGSRGRARSGCTGGAMDLSPASGVSR